MTSYDLGRIQREITTLDHASSTTAKGRKLERLAAYFLAEIPGVEAVDRNRIDYFKSGERDLWLNHLPWISALPFADIHVPVECKNLKRKASAADVRVFASKILTGGGWDGLLVTRHGLSGGPGEAGHKAIEEALVQRVRIIVISVADLSKITDTAGLLRLLSDRLGELRALQTYISV
jgi:hypothetical protein